MSTKSESLNVPKEKPVLNFTEKRTRQLYVRVTPTHANLVEKAAADLGVSMAEVMGAILDLAHKEGVI